VQKNQPGVVLRFQAKPGKGEELFQQCAELHFTGDPDGLDASTRVDIHIVSSS
jgi:hypothetical protein